MNSRRRYLVVAILVLAIAAVLVTPSARSPILLGVGQTLIAEDAPAIEPVDAIVVAVDAGVAGLLEAADLVHGGVATRVATFVGPPRTVDLELLARGVPIEDREAEYRRTLNALGVASVIPIPRVTGTEDQGRVLPVWCEERGLRSVLVVTTWHHSRRLQRVLERAMAGHETTVSIRIARHTEFDPDSWWQERDGARTVITEIQKLMLDFLRHPF